MAPVDGPVVIPLAAIPAIGVNTIDHMIQPDTSLHSHIADCHSRSYLLSMGGGASNYISETQSDEGARDELEHYEVTHVASDSLNSLLLALSRLAKGGSKPPDCLFQRCHRKWNMCSRLQRLRLCNALNDVFEQVFNPLPVKQAPPREVRCAVYVERRTPGGGQGTRGSGASGTGRIGVFEVGV